MVEIPVAAVFDDRFHFPSFSSLNILYNYIQEVLCRSNSPRHLIVYQQKHTG